MLGESSEWGAEVRFLQSQIALERGADDEALEGLRRCLYLWPDYLPANLELAQIYERSGAPERAQPLYRVARRLIESFDEDASVVPGDDRPRDEWVAYLDSKLV